MPTVTPIPLLEGKNAPGYRKVYICPASDVSAIAAAVAGDVATAITMVATKTFAVLPIDPEAGAFLTIEQPEAEGSTGYMYTFTAFLAGQSAAQRAAIDSYDGVYCLLIGQRANGTLEIIGEVGRGMRLRPAFENAGKAGNRVGIALVGSMDYPNLPYEYSDGTIAE
jgi:hypothetical protein